MAKLKASVKASTLLEVIVAMVIILVVFGLAMGIYTHVLGATHSVQQEKVKAITTQVISQSIQEQNWGDEESLQDSIALVKTVLPYGQYPDLVLITVTASVHGKEIGKSRQIVKKTADEK